MDKKYRIQVDKYKSKIDYTPQVRTGFAGKWLNLIKENNKISEESTVRYIYDEYKKATAIITEYKAQIIDDADESTVLDTTYDYL